MFNDCLFSGVTILFFLFAYLRRNKDILSLFFIILGGVLLRIYLSSDFFLHEWDERFHALVAKNLIRHPLTPTLYDNPLLPVGFKEWVDGHVWLHKQPLPLWSMALSMKLFGVNEMALRLPSILLSTAGILLTFLIGKELFSKKTGLIAAFLFSIHGLIIELTAGRVATDHIDLFFLFFIELGVYFSVLFFKRKKQVFNICVGIAIGLAVLCKWLPAFIVVPIWFCINYKNSNRKELILSLLIIFIAALVVFLPWQLYILKAFPAEAKWEYAYSFRHFTEVLDNNGGPFYYHFDKMRIIFGELIYFPVLWLIFEFFKRKNLFKRGTLLAWIIIPYLFFSVPKTKMMPYIIFCAPAFFLLTAYFYSYLKYIKSKCSRKFKWLVVAVQFGLILLPIRYSIERLKLFTNVDRNPLWVREIKSFNKKIPSNSVIFNYQKSIEAMFYSDFTVYQKIPSVAEIELLKNKNYKIAIYDNYKIPPDIRERTDVIIFK